MSDTYVWVPHERALIKPPCRDTLQYLSVKAVLRACWSAAAGPEGWIRMTKLMAEPPISRSHKRSGSPGARAPFGALWWRANSDGCTGLDEKHHYRVKKNQKAATKGGKGSQNDNGCNVPHYTHLRIFVFSGGDLHECHSKDSKDSKLKIKNQD